MQELNRMNGKIPANLLIACDLLAISGVYSYDSRVTNEEFWRAVGEFLLIQRTRKGLNPIDIDRAGGPDYATVQSIEKGKVGQTRTLEGHANALGMSLPDLFRAVLSSEDTEPATPELTQVVKKFRSTDVLGRQAMLALAQALPDEERREPSELPTDQTH